MSKSLLTLLVVFCFAATAHAAATYTQTNVIPGEGQAQNYTTEQSPSGGNTEPHTTQTNLPVPHASLSSPVSSGSTPDLTQSQSAPVSSLTSSNDFIGPVVSEVELLSASDVPALPKTGPGALLLFFGAASAALLSKKQA